jgi:nucleotide-binding universal stress UspA family protein
LAGADFFWLQYNGITNSIMVQAHRFIEGCNTPSESQVPMYNKILAPFDGSQRAEAILPHLEEMAKRYNAEVILVRMVEPVNMDVSIFDVPPSRRVQEVTQELHDAKAYLTDLVDRLAEHGVPTKMYVRYGSIVKTILEIAKEENVDLIMLASHGRTGMGRMVYGSVAAGILHGAECPLLVIRSQDDDLPA